MIVVSGWLGGGGEEGRGERERERGVVTVSQ